MDDAAKLLRDAQIWLVRAQAILGHVVDRYAYAQAIANNMYRDDYVTNDFFYYCITKSTKSLGAINLLLKAALAEDAQILLRSVYENYLAVAFLSANPKCLDDLVDKKVGVSAGRYKHPVAKSGKKNRKKIVDPLSGEQIQFDIPVAEMASKSKYLEDEKIHWPLYGFLSEHCHVHFIAMGNYINEDSTRFSYTNRSQLFQASIYSLYVCELLIGEVVAFEDLTASDLRKTCSLLRSGSKLLLRAFELMTFVGHMENMPAGMRQRIERHSVLPSKSNRGVQPTPNLRG